jgi:hypothetical protein
MRSTALRPRQGTGLKQHFQGLFRFGGMFDTAPCLWIC